ncbi:phosphoenolpyruvate synthase [Pyrobaculum neutrophilum]|uniref:Phosphoenolpyruvate synthase n=1 Tax=Pyrobaculum neutrophilum (strain DSM 2338 / JCM 9278 / NBRC 100436 / V24Sta) TaxID=444157 RepID=B1Y8Q3_PYRNV|nr:phosphoenolpyruvate synthase [Pyrobaculum neutrophilum]ACB40132.1 phosphoenolpyruvate synthase [Pyrobaculum neutrophilum V24Sta]
MRFIKWISEVGKNDIVLVGGKGANLGEVARIAQVPPGFVVTSEAFRYFLEATGLRERIKGVLSEFITKGEPEEYEKASAEIRKMVESSPLPADLEKEIAEAYARLCEITGVKNVAVAVRSSATAEDIPEASFAGQQDTYLNVRGVENVVTYVKKVWSSLYTARALYYREKMGIPHEKSLMAVVVQKLVNARSAGVMFTLDPTNGDRSKVVIEASWGLGEGVVRGIVTPDEYVVDKATMKIVEKRISTKKVAVVRDDGGLTKEVELPLDKAQAPALEDSEVVELAKMAVKLEQHYGHPVDIEFAVDADMAFPQNLFILQARPETVWSRKQAEVKKEEGAPAGAVVVRGIAASPGVAVGAAKVCLTLDDAKKKLKKGDILVTKMTDPDWVPYMRLAAAIVTDEGGRTSHAAIVSRELGIPAVVGTGNATSVLKDGEIYTVDGSRGVVLAGAAAEKAEERKPAEGAAVAPKEIILHIYRSIPTGTKVYMNLGEPDKIDEYKDLPFDGIGLMRIEFVISSWVGQHPLYLLSIGKEDKFVSKMAEGIAKVASAIYPRPVVVRFSDFKSNEYRGLEGGEKFEPEERNPMLGWRGVSRYISPQYEKAFRLELKAIKKAREEMGLTNVWVMAPFVRTVWEAERFAKLLEEEGLVGDRDFKVWAMAEVPSIAFMVEEFSQYFDGFSIGSNDLTQLVLGVDRDNDILVRINPKYFDEREAPVLRAIYELIRRAHKMGRTVSICGQGPSVYPQLVEFLVRAGIDSISVNPDAVLQTRVQVASVELKVLRERLDAIYSALYKHDEQAEFYEILKKVFGKVNY